MARRKNSTKILDETIFKIEGVLVVNGLEDKVIVSPDPDEPLTTNGKRLRELGLDVVGLIKDGYLIPTTNQTHVEEIVFGGS